MKTSYTTLTVILFTSSVSANKSTDNGWTLEQCFPDSIPWYSFQGTDYIFTREKYNSICVDSHGKQYQWGKILGVNPPIDEPNSGCSAACVSGYGRGEERGCTSMKPEKLVGFNYNCDEDACYCLYEKNTWSGDSSPCFDEMDTSNKGKGDVYKTKVEVGSTCYSLQTQPSPTEEPSPTPAPQEPRGKSICTRSPDHECYKTGRPACCSSDEYDCPSYMTMCDNHGEGMSGTSYCTYGPQFGCTNPEWSNMGYPKCCDEPGGDVINCPIEQPPCNAEESSGEAASVSTAQFVKYLRVKGAANN